MIIFDDIIIAAAAMPCCLRYYYLLRYDFASDAVIISFMHGFRRYFACRCFDGMSLRYAAILRLFAADCCHHALCHAMMLLLRAAILLDAVAAVAMPPLRCRRDADFLSLRDAIRLLDAADYFPLIDPPTPPSLTS